MVSPSTSVPVKNAIPSVTARKVDASRRRWATTFFSAIRNMPPVSVANRGRGQRIGTSADVAGEVAGTGAVAETGAIAPAAGGVGARWTGRVTRKMAPRPTAVSRLAVP